MRMESTTQDIMESQQIPLYLALFNLRNDLNKSLEVKSFRKLAQLVQQF